MAILYVAGAFRLTRAAVGRCPRSRRYLLAGSVLVLVAAAWVGIGLVRPVPDNPAPGLAVAHAVTLGLRIAGAWAVLVVLLVGGLVAPIGVPLLSPQGTVAYARRVGILPAPQEVGHTRVCRRPRRPIAEVWMDYTSFS